jgi:hypothetical protein
MTYNYLIMTNEEFMIVANAFGSIGIVLTGWFLIVRFVKPMFKRVNFWMTTWERFMIDWAGEEARPGRDAVPGVMERLNEIDGQLRNNGGSSLKDAVDRIESRIEKGDKKFLELQKEIQEIKKKTDNL